MLKQMRRKIHFLLSCLNGMYNAEVLEILIMATKHE